MQHYDCGARSGGGERSSGGRSVVDEVADRDGGAENMRNRPVKLDPKLTVLLYVLTRRGGLDRIARRLSPFLSSLSVSPCFSLSLSLSLPSSLSLRGGDGTPGEVSANAAPASTSAETICELQQKAAAPNYFRPQATTVDNLITEAIPTATWPLHRVRTNTLSYDARRHAKGRKWGRPFHCRCLSNARRWLLQLWIFLWHEREKFEFNLWVVTFYTKMWPRFYWLLW